MKSNSRVFLIALASIFILSIFLISYAIAGDEDENLLPNGSFEEVLNKNGVKINKAANGALSAVKDWSVWINGGDTVTTEPISKKDFVLDGQYSIRITTDGAQSGLYMIYLPGNIETITYSAWVYVLDGIVAILAGSNSKGFDSAKSKKNNEWELLNITVDGAKIPEEVLIYSQDGSVDLYVDAAWLNYGNKSTNPVSSLKAKAVDSKGKLTTTWANIKAR
jgi:hypothetical protein